MVCGLRLTQVVKRVFPGRRLMLSFALRRGILAGKESTSGRPV